MGKEVVLYSSQECPHCSELKTLLTNAYIKYSVVDVDKDEAQWDDLCKTLNVEFVPTVIIVNGKEDTGQVLTPDVHFDEISECFDLIVKALR